MLAMLMRVVAATASMAVAWILFVIEAMFLLLIVTVYHIVQIVLFSADKGTHKPLATGLQSSVQDNGQGLIKQAGDAGRAALAGSNACE